MAKVWCHTLSIKSFAFSCSKLVPGHYQTLCFFFPGFDHLLNCFGSSCILGSDSCVKCCSVLTTCKILKCDTSFAPGIYIQSRVLLSCLNLALLVSVCCRKGALYSFGDFEEPEVVRVQSQKRRTLLQLQNGLLTIVQ